MTVEWQTILRTGKQRDRVDDQSIDFTLRALLTLRLRCLLSELIPTYPNLLLFPNHLLSIITLFVCTKQTSLSGRSQSPDRSSWIQLADYGIANTCPIRQEAAADWARCNSFNQSLAIVTARSTRSCRSLVDDFDWTTGNTSRIIYWGLWTTNTLLICQIFAILPGWIMSSPRWERSKSHHCKLMLHFNLDFDFGIGIGIDNLNN